MVPLAANSLASRSPISPSIVLLLALLLLLPPATALSLSRLNPLSPRAVLPASAAESRVTLVTGSTLAGDFVCRSTGECAPCPPNELETPLCKIYGNRRPLTCVSLLSDSSSNPILPSASNDRINMHTPPLDLKSGETTAGGDKNGAKNESSRTGVEVGQDSLVEEALRLDPDPENLDDEELQDALRGEADVDEERRRRREQRQRQEIQWRQQQTRAPEIYTWEACARVVKKERADFFEFVLCNLFFASASVAVLIYRHRALASRQYGRLAARIGVSLDQ